MSPRLSVPGRSYEVPGKRRIQGAIAHATKVCQMYKPARPKLPSVIAQYSPDCGLVLILCRTALCRAYQLPFSVREWQD